MLLAINIGNTNTGVTVFESDRIAAQVTMMSAADGAFATLIAPMWEWYRELGYPLDDPLDVAIASVVPRATQELVKFFDRSMALHPLIINSGLKLPLQILYDNPSQLGADRLCNAVAAKALYQRKDQPLVVVDIGTATTFEVLSATGDFLGGPIAPGPATAVANLADKTAQLFEVPIEPQAGAIITTDTENALKAGSYHSAVGGMKTILRLIEGELAATPFIVGTGGLAETIHSFEKIFDVIDPNLTAQGIRLLFDFQAH